MRTMKPTTVTGSTERSTEGACGKVPTPVTPTSVSGKTGSLMGMAFTHGLEVNINQTNDASVELNIRR